MTKEEVLKIINNLPKDCLFECFIHVTGIEPNEFHECKYIERRFSFECKELSKNPTYGFHNFPASHYAHA